MTDVAKLNHIDVALVKCSSAAQRALRDNGFTQMSHVLHSASSMISWEEAERKGAPPQCERAFAALISNLKLTPETEHPDKLQDFFLQGTSGRERNLVWQYRIPARHLSTRRILVMNWGEPERTFRYTGHYLVPTAKCSPARDSSLLRILVRKPKFTGSHLHLGQWNESNQLFSQYTWSDGTAIINSSTAQLRILQTLEHARLHGALSKWETQIAFTIPTDIWQLIWIPSRSAAENTFLWQFYYRIPATNKWRFPTSPATDPNTWCSRCQLNVQEDIFHCIWDCSASRGCWLWCSALLAWASGRQSHSIHLSPAHVIIGEALPAGWETPDRMWNTLRATMCWIVWKDRNEHVFSGQITNTHRMIGQVWSRLGVYVKIAWRERASSAGSASQAYPARSHR